MTAAMMMAMSSLAILPSVPVNSAGSVLVGDGNDRFAYQTEAADLNRDGEIDLVVTAPHPNGGNVVYVFFGPHSVVGQQLDPANADVIIQGPAGSETGWSIATGDLFGDNTQDLIIGAPGENEPDGVIYVFESPLAPASYSTNDASVAIAGSGAGYFGWSVTAGNFDGSGKDELAVGACDEDQVGRTYLFELDGASTPFDTGGAIATFDGAGKTGCALANPGDLNGDDYEDLLIGSYGSLALTGRAYGGAVSIVYGRAVFDSHYALDGDDIAQDIAHITGEQTGENVGYALAPAGDVNDDGYDDFLIGAPAIDCELCGVRDARGGAYLVLGAPDRKPGGGEGRSLHGRSRVSTVADVLWDASVSNDLTGISVAAAGFAGLTYSTWGVSNSNPPIAFTGPVLLFGTGVDQAYAIPYDAKFRLGKVPQYGCDWDPELGLHCTLDRSNVPPSRHVRRDLAAMTTGGHRFVGAQGSAFGLEVLGPGDLDGDGPKELMFGAPAQVNFEDPAGDGEAFVFRGQ